MGRVKKAEGQQSNADLLQEIEALRRQVEELEKAKGETKRVAAELGEAEGIPRDITERKCAEEALRRSEEWFRSLIELGASVYTVVDAEGRITYESPSVQRVFGWRPEEFEGKDVFHLVHPDDVERARRVFEDALFEPGVVKSVEVRFQHKDASWRTVEINGVNLLENRAVSGVILTSNDVTERKWAEEALRQEKGRFSAFIEDSAFGYAEMDLQGRLTFTNRRVEEMSGYSADELHKMHFSQLIVPEELERAQKELAQALTEPNSGPRYHKARRKDGALLDIEVNTLPLRRAGKPFGFQVTVEDIGGREEPA